MFELRSFAVVPPWLQSNAIFPRWSLFLSLWSSLASVVIHAVLRGSCTFLMAGSLQITIRAWQRRLPLQSDYYKPLTITLKTHTDYFNWCSCRFDQHLDWPLPERAGSWIPIKAAKVRGIVWTRNRIRAKMPHRYNFCVPGCTNSHNCSDAAFLLVPAWILSLVFFPWPVPRNDPKCLRGTDSDPAAHPL